MMYSPLKKDIISNNEQNVHLVHCTLIEARRKRRYAEQCHLEDFNIIYFIIDS